MTEANEERTWTRISPKELARLRAEEQAAYDRWRAEEEAKEEAARLGGWKAAVDYVVAECARIGAEEFAELAEIVAKTEEA